MMIKKLSATFPVLLLAFLFWLAPTPVHADAVNYQALKYGTESTSLAAGYYVQPANVEADGDQYLVTMTIHTGSDLGKWPVTVLSINGTGPANVTKTQSASGFDYSYAFATADLSQPITSSISINVPDVYVAKHDISFRFDTSHLPALTNAASSSASSASAQAASSSQASATASKTAATTKADAVTKKQAKLINDLNRKNKQTQQAIVIGGVAGTLILGIAAYFFIKRK